MSIGMIDISDRMVRPNTELGKLVNFGSLENTNPILHPDGTVPQTVAYMNRIVRDRHKGMERTNKDVVNCAFRNILSF